MDSAARQRVFSVVKDAPGVVDDAVSIAIEQPLFADAIAAGLVFRLELHLQVFEECAVDNFIQRV